VRCAVSAFVIRTRRTDDILVADCSHSHVCSH